MSATTLDHRCPARHASQAAIAACVDEFCARAALPRPVALRLQLALEELLANTIEHGHGGESDALVSIRMHVDDAGIELRYEDGAAVFDPRPQIARSSAERDAPADERPVGGLGLVLLHEMAQSFEHEALAAGNRITLRFAR